MRMSHDQEQWNSGSSNFQTNVNADLLSEFWQCCAFFKRKNDGHQISKLTFIPYFLGQAIEWIVQFLHLLMKSEFLFKCCYNYWNIGITYLVVNSTYTLTSILHAILFHDFETWFSVKFEKNISLYLSGSLIS